MYSKRKESFSLANNHTNFKAVAFPREHGSWGFVFEPLVLSLIVAFSPAGLQIAIASFLAFLAHQPVRIILRKAASKALKKNAVIFLGIYFFAASFCMFGVIKKTDIHLLFPLAIVLIFMLYFLYLETVNSARNVYAELIGPVAIDLIALTIVLIDGWAVPSAVAFFIVLLNRSVPTTFFIHERLNKLKHHKVNIKRIYYISVAGLIAVIVLAVVDLVPFLSVVAVLLLLVRVITGFAKFAEKLTVKQIGILEFIYGALFVIITAAGYLTGI